MIRKRPLGRTGLQVSELGLGAWAIGGKSYGKVPEQEAIATIEAYLQVGGNLLDTAHGYGESERLIGQTLGASGIPRSDIVIVTKSQNSAEMGRLPLMMDDLQTSLERMRTDYVDVLMMHSPPSDPRTLEQAAREIEEMRRQGLVRFIGASIKGPNVTDETVAMCRQYLQFGQVEVFEIIYSILRQKLEEEGVLQASGEQGVGLVVRTVLESGFLTGKYRIGEKFPQGDHRNRWSAESLQRILESVEELGGSVPSGVPDLAAMSIQFALLPPSVSTVIVGAKTPEQLRRNIEAAALPALPEETIRRLQSFGRGRSEPFNP
jgi:aryl-alcohol dehydrogenase-like predicted oxidoreductase